MVLTPFSFQRSRAVLAAMILCVSMAVLWNVSSARGQQQEKGFLDRLDHPDRTLHFSGSDKPFAVSSTATERRATVHPFAFSRSANLRAGDGAFNTRAFSSKDQFRTEGFSTRKALVFGQSFAQTNKTFDTKSVDVREDRAANKTLAVQEYSAGEKLFLGRGKRQDTIDELRKEKNLSIDQVREILNKNK